MNVILLSCAIVVLLMSTAYMIFEYYSYRDTLKSQVSTLAAVVAANSSAAVAFQVPRDADEVLAALREEKHIVAAAIYDKEGKLFSKYPSNIIVSALPAVPGKKGLSFQGSFLEGFQPVMQEKAEMGTLYIRSDMGAMYAQLRRYGIIGLLLFCFSLIVAYILSQVLQKSISEPILQLEQTAKVISEERDYSVRAAAYGKDELGALTTAFNHMLTRIESQNQEITLFNQTLEATITKRTHALEEANETLKQQKEFVETIINSSIDVIAVFDKDLNYVMLNKQAEAFYNFNGEDIVGQNLLDIYPQVKNLPIMKDLESALEGTSVNNPSYRSELLNKFFEYSYIPLKDNNGKVYGVLTIVHDISNIMESHEKLTNLNTELLKSNRDLEQFAYIASHDLQEPLRKIQVFTQLIGENYDDKANLQKYQEKINQSAARMQDLIQDVLDFSRISKTEDAMEMVDLNEVIRNLQLDFELLVQEKEAVIKTDPLPVIEGISLQLSQLFSNLISNSIKYNDKKPIIKITSRPLKTDEVNEHSRLTNKQDYMQINVIDNGIGFEPAYREQIFTIFQRLHGRQAYSGTGIGLAICRKIVENHQGIINAEAELGKGAVFTIILPLKQA